MNEKEAFFSLFYEEESFLFDLEKSARSRQVPIVRREMAQFLQLLLMIKKPQTILEVGTAIGYSALLMSQFLPENGKILTIERNPLMWQEAQQQFKRAEKWLQQQVGLSVLANEQSKFLPQPDKIELKIGDAAQILPQLTATFDFVFLDSAKAQYINFLPEILRLLKPEGLLVTDNVLQAGEIMRSKYLLTRRERTTHRRMRQYLRAISHQPELSTFYFGMADGVTVCVKKGAKTGRE
ncbi:O-methyltransferase [Clostridiales bacterium COT073_COT-073]|nr:O-methyltransferase [Clostridiales bacterium COT073_COT-073]